MTDNIEHLFRQALDAHLSGNSADAEKLYRIILELQPKHSHASHNLGVLVYALNRPTESLQLFKSALDANPDESQFWVSYIEALSRTGQLDLAMRALDDGRKLGLSGANFDELAQRLTPAWNSINHDLNALLELYNNGQNDRAEKLALSLLDRSPNHPFCWKLLGALYKRTGNLDQSVAANKKAVDLSPADAEAQNNLGGTLKDAGHLMGAIERFKNAIALMPDYPEPYYNLGIAFKDLGKRGDAEKSYRTAIRLRSHYADAYNNLGIVLHETGRFLEASNIYSLVLALAPNYPPAYFNFSITLQEQDKFEKAEAILKRIIILDPNYPGAHTCLGLTLVANNKPTAALQLAISLNVEEPTPESKDLFAGLAQKIIPISWDPQLANVASSALLEPWGRPSDLMPFACRLLKTHKALTIVLDDLNQAVVSESPADPLSIPFLKTDDDCLRLLKAMLIASPIADLELERFLSALRHQVLLMATSANFAIGHSHPVPDVSCALACQCFINEYVYFETAEEIALSNQLRSQLIHAIKMNQTIPEFLVIAVACYFPLYSIEGAMALLHHNWSQNVQLVVQQQIKEPMDERDLYPSIANLTKIEDKVSLAVKTLYEENPYPRWIRVPGRKNKQTLNLFIQGRVHGSEFHHFAEDRDIDVLTAGCGTGQDPIEAAQSIARANILAIDLSISSLGYAKRKALEIGLNSVEFYRADILNLGSIGLTFDLIESNGVLHHLQNPFAGWEVLLSLLRPHGIMRLGFYSELARRDIVRVRRLVAAEGIGSSFQDIRNFRQRLIDLNSIEEFGFAISSSDFFSTSACRDLLFHIQEHRLNLNMIANFLESHRLDFLGFDIDRAVIQAYRRRFPNDFSATSLENWHVFEEENPDTFVAMYQFFIQKNDLA